MSDGCQVTGSNSSGQLNSVSVPPCMRNMAFMVEMHHRDVVEIRL